MSEALFEALLNPATGRVLSKTTELAKRTDLKTVMVNASYQIVDEAAPAPVVEPVAAAPAVADAEPQADTEPAPEKRGRKPGKAGK